MDAQHFPFLSWVTKKDDTNGTQEQLTQVLWVYWFREVSEGSTRWTKGHWGWCALRTRLRSCTDRSRADLFREGTTSLTRRVRPLTQQCFHHRATDVLVWQVRDNYLALQLFFFSQNCWDLILMLLCSFVFSCKHLTVLECLYFIKCV